jgi:uncharacterized protein (DUF1697 family)
VTSCIALLRSVNVGGHKAVAMADLRDLLTQLGFAGARSLLQSGNLIFDGKAHAAADLERFLETEAEKRLGLRTDVLLRTVREWRAIVARNPFPDEAKADPGHLLAVFLKEAPAREAVQALQAAMAGPEILRVDGRQAYIVYPMGIGRSRLTHRLIESKLETRGTGRNWNTVLKLAALAEA